MHLGMHAESKIQNGAKVANDDRCSKIRRCRTLILDKSGEVQQSLHIRDHEIAFDFPVWPARKVKRLAPRVISGSNIEAVPVLVPEQLSEVHLTFR